MFIDQAEIFVQSGKGGNGMVHFRREKFVPRGGPDGGDGGRGGDLILEVKVTLSTLAAFHQDMRFIAQDGKSGGSNNKYGKSADDLVVYVPPGTVVYDASTGNLIGDLTEKGQRLVICKGGRGGRGNTHFKSARNQAPLTGEKGEPGEEKRLRLELKLIADIGIIGVPNAGKSTLLSVLTNAKPDIAPYPFTTLIPNLGVASIDADTHVVLADIPGLIEGASRGVGLGFEFLRHIQRTRVLIHLLDGMGEDPLADFSQINSEMALFDPRLAKKTQVVALNKLDQPEVQEQAQKIQEALKERGVDVILISAMSREGVREVLMKAYQHLQDAPSLEELSAPENVPAMPVYKPQDDPQEFEVVRENGDEWRVVGPAIERAASMTYWQHAGSVRRFQRIMAAIGVDEALRKAGVRDGDTVFIADFELEWQE